MTCILRFLLYTYRHGCVPTTQEIKAYCMMGNKGRFPLIHSNVSYIFFIPVAHQHLPYFF